MCFLCARGRVKVITKSKKPTWRGDIFFNQMNTKSLHFAFSERSDCGCIFASVFILALYIYIYIRSLFVLLIISLMHKVDMFALLLWWSFLLRRVDTFLERWTKVNGKWKINIQAEWHYGMKCLCVQYIYIYENWVELFPDCLLCGEWGHNDPDTASLCRRGSPLNRFIFQRQHKVFV